MAEWEGAPYEYPEERGGMSPLTQASLVSGGAATLESLANRMFGAGDRKRLKRFAAYLESQRGREVLSEAARERIMGYLNRAGAPNRNRVAGDSPDDPGGVSGSQAGASDQRPRGSWRIS